MAFDAVQRAAQMIPTEGAVEMKQAMLEEMDRTIEGRYQSSYR
jgi:hypothetical protein